MMNIEQFMKTVYLGDRYIKEIIIDAEKSELKIKANMISRIRSEDGNWNYYNEENIEDGYLVFSGLKTFSFEPQGIIPNDEICDYEINVDQKGFFNVRFDLGAYVDRDKDKYQKVSLNFKAKHCCIEDSKNNFKRIYE